jgi:hypothetical protein
VTRQFRARSINIASFALPVFTPLLVASCSLQNFEYLQADLGDTGTLGMGGGSSAGAATGGTSTGADESAGGTSQGGATVGATGGTSATGGKSSTGTAPRLGPWEFDSQSSISDWAPFGTGTDPNATTAWIAEGETDPLGSLVLTTPGTASFVVNIPASSANQEHGKVCFRLRTDSGAAKVKPFAMSTGWAWADAGEQAVDTSWSTAVLNFDALSYVSVNFDPKALVNFGLQLPNSATATAPATLTVWIDRVWLE